MRSPFPAVAASWFVIAACSSDGDDTMAAPLDATPELGAVPATPTVDPSDSAEQMPIDALPPTDTGEPVSDDSPSTGGSGGTDQGSGGTVQGGGGTDQGSGGADQGSGGTDQGSGGTDQGSGGTDQGSGGTDQGSGGAPGSGGAAQGGSMGVDGGAAGAAGAPVEPIDPAAARWTRGPDLPDSIGEVAGGIIGDTLFVLGEGDPDTLAYDIATDTWLPTDMFAQRPHTGHHHTAFVYQDKLYLIGGLSGDSEGTVQIFDPAQNEWTLGPSASSSSGSGNAAVVGNLAYYCGGIIGNNTVDDCGIYDLDADMWSPMANMPEGRNHAACASEGSKVFVFGGRTGRNSVTNGFDSVQAYDIATSTWDSTTDPDSTLAPLPIGRGGMGAAVFAHGEFYVFGGETQNGPGATDLRVYERVDIYNPETNTWRQGPDLPIGMHGIWPMYHDRKIYLAGGGVRAGGSQSDIFQILEL